VLKERLRTGIPAPVARNTLLLAIAQALVGMGNQLVPALGAIIVVRLLGSAGLAGVGTAILGGGRLIVAYPLGRVMDVYGRRVGLALGLLMGLTGAIVIGLSVAWGSFPLFVVGMFVFGLGVGATHQLRVAAADMYPPERRAQGLGLVLTGSLLGALGGPALVSSAEAISDRMGWDTLVLAWLLVPVVLVPALLLVLQVRPDPKEISANLSLYYPGYEPPQPAAAEATPSGMGSVLRNYACWTAFLCSAAAWGVMVMMMAMTPLVMEHHGHSLPAISLTVAIHVVGMFGFSLPLGRLADTLGRRAVLFLGLVSSALGALLVPVTEHYWLITLGLFLVGLGWSAITVAATAIIADATRPAERAQAIGINDALSSALAIVMPLLGGPISELWGHGALGLVSLALVAAPALPLLALRGTAPAREAAPA
jgi:MFS family permease